MGTRRHALIDEPQRSCHDGIAQLSGGKPLPTFCADVTKLIAADSWLQLDAYRDPEASTAFSELTTVLANPVDTSKNAAFLTLVVWDQWQRVGWRRQLWIVCYSQQRRRPASP